MLLVTVSTSKLDALLGALIRNADDCFPNLTTTTKGRVMDLADDLADPVATGTIVHDIVATDPDPDLPGAAPG
jgi:hypothetical protein